MILVLLYRIRSFFHLILFSYFIDFVSFRYNLFSYFTDFVVSFRWVSFSYFTDFVSFRWISFSYFTDFVSFRWISFSYSVYRFRWILFSFRFFSFLSLPVPCWFSSRTSVSFTNITDCHDIAEILFKVVLNKNHPLTLTPKLTLVR